MLIIYVAFLKLSRQYEPVKKKILKYHNQL